ncbi:MULTISPECIES: hypothetical protein [unclassified Streptomyces]|uniref:hypothetical protein n=1 Tax=unclassified Streptomyces TaxID=2593676 RepID=UPI002E2B2593|nr:hypothetical protein [Streptomyces sp. NBC_00690]
MDVLFQSAVDLVQMLLFGVDFAIPERLERVVLERTAPGGSIARVLVDSINSVDSGFLRGH